MIIQETIRIAKDDFETQMTLHEKSYSSKFSTEYIENYYNSLPKVDTDKMKEFASRDF